MLKLLISRNGHILYVIKTFRLSEIYIIYFKLLIYIYLHNKNAYVYALFNINSYLFSFVLNKNSLPIKLSI